MKRFTDTLKWDKAWFQELDPVAKCFWMYICDQADNAGVWEPNFKLASFIIGGDVNKEFLIVFGDRITELENGKFWLPNFIEFQYGELSKDCRPHLKIFESLNKNGIDYHVDQNLVRRSRTGHISQGKRQSIYARDGAKCVYCSSEIDLEPDHILPRSKGGSDEIDNLLTACKKCNSLRQNRPIHEFISTLSDSRKQAINRLLNTLSKLSNRLFNNLQEEETEKDKEVKGSAEGKNPRMEAVIKHGKTTTPPSDLGFCEWWWNTQEGSGWVDKNGIPVRNWKSSFNAAWSSTQHRSQEKASRGGNGYHRENPAPPRAQDVIPQ